MTDLRTPPVSDGDLFSERARQYFFDRDMQRIHILEAGCGWGEGLRLGDMDHHVTGVDMEGAALRAHTRDRGDLDAWHLGDLRTVPMPPRAYDIVHASYLLERLPNTELVLDRFVAALKPGGLLLVRFRDRATAFGALDRLLPGWTRRGTARATGEGPPPAIYERLASSAGMQWYCVMRGLVITEEYSSSESLAALGRWSRPAAALCRMVAAVTRGRLPADHTEVTLVIRKPENRFARVI